MNRSLFCNSLLVGILAAAGCSAGGPEVEFVEGVVTMDGQPVEGATISFSPVDKSGTAAVGTTDASGVFKLTAIPDGAADQGTKAGEYLVGIIKHKSEPAVALSTDDPNYGKETRSSTEAPKIERIVPQKYENPATSGFKVTVKPGTNNGDDFKFNLKKE